MFKLSFVFLFLVAWGCKTSKTKEDPTIYKKSFTGYNSVGETTWCYQPEEKIDCSEDLLEQKKRYKEACLEKGHNQFDCGCYALCSKLVPLF